MLGLVAALAYWASLAHAETRTVTDMAGRQVAIPSDPYRISCFEVLCYEKFFLLGAADRVAQIYRTDPPWMAVVDPAAAKIPKVEGTPNREALLEQGIDLIMLRSVHLPAVGAIGLPAVVSQPPLDAHFADAAAFMETQKRMIRLFGQIAGGDAVRRAEDWCAYYDAHITKLVERVRDVAAERRPRVYYLRGPAAVNTQGPNSDTYWYGQIVGANMIVGGMKLDGQGPMALEEILRLDPEYIFVGRQYSPDLVLKDPAWREVSAVRNHHVVPLPDGFSYWDGGTDGALLADFIAKTLYPDRFTDLDLAAELQGYYRKFYGFTFTPDQIELFLAGLPPSGRRRGY